MTSIKSQLSTKTWSKDDYYISTDVTFIPISALSSVFASEEFYWAKSLPEAAMREMLENSLTFGLFEKNRIRNASTATVAGDSLSTAHRETDLKFIGIARCVTDFITFAYLTDVWVDPSYQGKGLGSWLVDCVQTVLQDMPHLRRSMLFTADWKRSVPFYERLMGMKVIETRMGEGLAVMESKGRGHPSYGKDGIGY